MQFMLQCFNAFKYGTHNCIVHENHEVKVVFDTQIPHQTSLLHETCNGEESILNHVDLNVTRCVCLNQT